MRAIATFVTLMLVAATPAHSYWRYAEWDMTPLHSAITLLGAGPVVTMSYQPTRP